MGIRVQTKGDFSKTKKFFDSMLKESYLDRVDLIAKAGVSALASATPVDTGKTAASWRYDIIKHGNGYTEIVWSNENLTKTGESIALMLQYGHGTGTGGYVKGRDYINPAMKNIYTRIIDEAWKAVCSA